MNMNKDTNDDGETSSSSSSMEMSQGQNLTSDNEIERGEKESKKIKRGESSSTLMEVEGDPSQEEEASMDNLPPEMLMEIFKCVDICSLFNCRLLNRNWSTIASGILRNRPHAVTRFEFNEDGFTWTGIPSPPDTQKRKSLRDFVTCIQNSKDCPFSQFWFSITEDADPLKIFRQKDFKEFTSYFALENQRIKCLVLSFECLKDLGTIQKLAPKLKDLLLNKIPRLEELVLDFGEWVEAPQLKLFSTPTTTEINVAPVQLPNLKVLEFYVPMILPYTEIVKDLLNAAVNLKELHMTIYNPEDFQFLHSLGKLHLLKKATLELKPDYLWAAKSDKNCAPLPLPKLEILELRIGTYRIIPISWNQAAKFLGKLFESSKNTLTEFKSEAVGFFPSLQLPTFTKLRKLELSQCQYSPQPVFPPGIRSSDVSPAVFELNLDIGAWDSAFPQEDSIPLLPNVKILSIKGSKCEEDAIPILALMCPNLKKLQISKDDNSYMGNINPPILNLLEVGRAIWTYMQQLESLEVDVDLDLPENNPTALDSCFTGISIENCQRLCDLNQVKKLLNKWGFPSNVPESELTAEREYVSILNMKDLKKLRINPYSGKTLLKRVDFFTKLSWISEEFAFKFIPHLKPKPEEED